MKVDQNFITRTAGAAVAVGIGLADLWHFHAMGTTADMGFIYGGLAIAGISVAGPAGFVLGQRAALDQAAGLAAAANKPAVHAPPSRRS